MKVEFLCSFQWISVICSVLLLAPFACSKNHGNAANDLLEIINKNRTSHNRPNLGNNPGLGCIALQYAEQCKNNCTVNNTIHCQPTADDFIEIFAPNCGVELPTFGSISGYILGCQKKYIDPTEAFSKVLVKDHKELSLLMNKTFSEAGVGIVGRHKHNGPYIWCVLFSSNRANSSFVLEDLGKGIEQKRGCYSGSSVDCSKGYKNSAVVINVWMVFFVFVFLFQVFVDTGNLILFC
ncbi:hypothetical protein BUALT_Bualt01G0189600 [Buddleja alternifolia]|uniref:SCP domain-containing protein n=1 Tax=Buddleja alternifolia TaxID=168488 RepID=A0AAV6YJ60_9LAMI|nr:hypothetical protein BUALT_Bualt01G0189600 [Buddleja alternifolia]